MSGGQTHRQRTGPGHPPGNLRQGTVIYGGTWIGD